MVVLGPDGSGKTTILDAAKPVLASHFNHISHFHWRPGLLPKLGRSATNSLKTPQAAPLPPKDFSYGKIISLIRYFYYLIDFFLGYLFKIRPLLRRGDLVIIERWHHDSLMNPQRYGFNVPARLLRLAHKLLPAPDLTLILRGDARKIHDRKPELSEQEILDQTRAILQLVPQLPDSAHIYTDVEPEESQQAFIQAIVAVIDNQSSEHSWRAFPSIGKAKLWISTQSSFKQACDLYTPRSRLAKMVTRVADLLPAKLNSRRLTRTEASLANRIQNQASKHFPDSDLMLDFYIGTPGPHQKITARIADNQQLLGYCKTGFTTSVEPLLTNEYQALQKIKSIAGQYPAAISLDINGQLSSLLISPPPSKASAWPLEINKAEINLLESLIDEQPASCDIKEILAGLDINSWPIAKTELHVFKQAEDSLKETFRNEPVYTVFSHGDFTPWNIKRLDDGSPFIFDWEYATTAPALFDLFHRIFSVEWLIKHKNADEIISDLLELQTEKEYQGIISKSRIQPEHYSAYLLLYLLSLAKRQTIENRCPPAVITESIEILLNRKGSPRPRVLVSAYACEPGIGSEPGVGWNWVSLIASQFDTWVITRTNNRESIEQALTANPCPNLHFVYADLPPYLRKWKKKQRGVRTYYYLWQFAALIQARKLHRQFKFDIGHHVTFVNDWLWTFFALTSIPFVWGPIGSHPALPLRFIPTAKGKIVEIIRLSIQAIMRAIDPLFWLSCIKARFILGINAQTFENIPLRFLKSDKYLVEPAIGIEEIASKNMNNTEERYEILFVGRFAPVKAPLLAIEAFSNFLEDNANANTRLTMIGEGPLKNEMVSLIEKKGIQKHVEILPWVERSEIIKHMQSSDIFLFPSFEGGGMVVLEAMATGLPVVCLNYGGPGSMVDDESGIRVKVGTYNQTGKDLSLALARLHNDSLLKKRLSTGAINRACNEFSWNNKLIKITNMYKIIISEQQQETRKQCKAL